jgi:hypothetical protein
VCYSAAVTPQTSEKLPSRWWGPLGKQPGARWVWLAFCVAFLATRLVVVETAVDHLHNVDGAEMRLVEHGYYLLGEAPRYESFVHLWGHRATALALVPLLALGVPGASAAKILAILVSFFGAATLVYVLAWKKGPWHAAVAAALLTMPDAPLLKWTLTLWGAYPEAMSLALATTALWVATLSAERPRALAAAGVATGLTLAYSPSVLFLPLALGAVTSLTVAPEKRNAATAWYALGAVLGFAPWLVWLAATGAGVRFEAFLASSGEQLPILASLGAPSLTRVAIFWRKLQVGGFPTDAIGVAIVLAAIGWTARAWRSPERAERWVLVFPATFIFGLLTASMFTLIDDLEIRHVLWLFPAMYACVAIALGDGLAWAARRKGGRRIALLALMVSMAALLVLPGAVRLGQFAQWEDWGRLQEFRGYRYYQLRLGSAVGDEIRRLNTLLDRRSDLIEQEPFLAGLREVFPMSGHYRCCLWEPLSFGGLDGVATDDPAYWEGVGCGLALKNPEARTDLWVAAERAPAAGNAALAAGFATCEALARNTAKASE